MPREKMVKIEGRLPRPQVFILDHEHFCEALGECRCIERQIRLVKTSKFGGEKSVVSIDRSVPDSITVNFRKQIEVPAAVLRVPSVAAALQRREIRVWE